jgi:hypothetical protein
LSAAERLSSPHARNLFPSQLFLYISISVAIEKPLCEELWAALNSMPFLKREKILLNATQGDVIWSTTKILHQLSKIVPWEVNHAPKPPTKRGRGLGLVGIGSEKGFV